MSVSFNLSFKKPTQYTLDTKYILQLWQLILEWN